MSEAFYRLTVRLPGGRRRTVWAEKRGYSRSGGSGLPTTETLSYRVLTREGEWTGEIIIAAPSDVVKQVPARMNMKYGELEEVLA